MIEEILSHQANLSIPSPLHCLGLILIKEVYFWQLLKRIREESFDCVIDLVSLCEVLGQA
jgi:hypothetical protein